MSHAVDHHNILQTSNRLDKCERTQRFMLEHHTNQHHTMARTVHSPSSAFQVKAVFASSASCQETWVIVSEIECCSTLRAAIATTHKRRRLAHEGAQTRKPTLRCRDPDFLGNCRGTCKRTKLPGAPCRCHMLAADSRCLLRPAVIVFRALQATQAFLAVLLANSGLIHQLLHLCRLTKELRRSRQAAG